MLRRSHVLLFKYSMLICIINSLISHYTYKCEIQALLMKLIISVTLPVIYRKNDGIECLLFCKTVLRSTKCVLNTIVKLKNLYLHFTLYRYV